MLSPTVEDISQVVILNPIECLVFWGHHSKGEGFTYGEALALSDTYHWKTTTWIGPRVKMHCIMCTLRDARGDLRMVRDQERDKTLEHIRQQYQESEEGGLQTPSCGRECTVQNAILPRGFWRNNQKEGRENARQVRETTAAKAENQVIGAGPHSPAAIDRRVCMLTMRHHKRPDRGIPWVEVTWREYHRNFMTPSTLHERISLIWCQIPIVRQRTGMTSLPMTPRHLDTPWWLTGSAAGHATAIEPTNTGIMNDTRDTARLNGWVWQYSETPLQTTPSHTMTGGVM